jgi:hypothetical protein
MQYAYNHAGRTFALIEDTERGRCHSGLVEYLLAYEQGQNNITLNGEP